MKITTNDQKLYKVDGKLKAEIDVYITREHGDAPSLKECRHAVLRVENKGGKGYVVYDRLLCRIVNGVFYMSLEEVLECAQYYNENPDAPQDMIPNGVALGLIYPKDSNDANG